MAKERALIVGAGRRHNAPLIAALSAAGLGTVLLARPSDNIRDDEHSGGALVLRLEAPILDDLTRHVVDPSKVSRLIICDSGFAHDEFIDGHNVARIDRRIAEVQDSVMAVTCASVALRWRPDGLLVFLGFVSAFRNHPGYRRFARGPRSGFDAAQALADGEAGFRVAYVGLDGEDALTDHHSLGPFILKLCRSRDRSPRWLYDADDLDGVPGAG